MAVPLEEKRRRRSRFMHALYERTDGRELEFVESHELGAELGWSPEHTDAVTDYLEREGLLKYPVMGAVVTITHAGVVEVERALSAPDEPTEHFAPLTSVVVVHGDVTGGQIMAGSPGGTQSHSTRVSDPDAVLAAVSQTREAIAATQVPEPQCQTLEARLRAVEAELALAEPDEGLIRQLLTSVRSVGENLVASGIWSALPLALEAF